MTISAENILINELQKCIPKGKPRHKRKAENKAKTESMETSLGTRRGVVCHLDAEDVTRPDKYRGYNES
jgi:hypothetical protein